MMRILVLILFCYCFSFQNAFAENNDDFIMSIEGLKASYDDLYTTNGEGKYDGYQKLNGYPLQEKFQIYFKDYSRNNITSFHVTYEDLRGFNYNEVWDFTLPDGTPMKITRGQVNSIFLEYENTEVELYLRSIFPGAYEDWFSGSCFSQDAERLVQYYLENKKQVPFEKKDIEIILNETSKDSYDVDIDGMYMRDAAEQEAISQVTGQSVTIVK